MAAGKGQIPRAKIGKAAEIGKLFRGWERNGVGEGGRGEMGGDGVFRTIEG